MGIRRRLTAAAVAAAAGAAAVVSMAPASAAPTQILGGLTDVSCVTTKICVAVGYRETDSGASPLPLSMVWDGSVWARRAVPVARPDSPEVLEGVSCPTAHFCLGVGVDQGSLGVGRAFSVSWNGSAWTLVGLPHVRGGNPQLFAVSCSSTTACTAVGRYQIPGRPLVLRWDGAAWKKQPAPAVADDATLTGVSCPTAGFCTAVGKVGSGGPRFVLQWNGADWTKVATARPAPHSTFSVLDNVYCRTARSCVAVGAYAVGDAESALVERWNGTAWRVQATPSSVSRLHDVACPAADACEAVGFLDTSDVGPPVPPSSPTAARWNGQKWNPQSVPQPGAYVASDLVGVARPGTTTCFAVGYFGNVAVIDRWNGTAWKLQRG